MAFTLIRDFAKKITYRVKHFKIIRSLVKFKYTQLRTISAWVCVSKNTVKLAADRYLTVFGVLSALAFSLIPVFPDLDTGNPSSILWLVGFLLLISVWFTFLLCRRDAQLYARILTDNVKTIYTLLLLSSLILKTMKRIRGDKYERPNAVSKARQIFEVIELVKAELADRFKIDTREFCDHFLLFSPNIFAHRAIKAGFNLRHSRKKGTREQTGYTDSLDLETTSIDEWMHRIEIRLIQIQTTEININHLEALFKAESTSSSVQLLAFMLQNSELPEDDLRLLFKILKAYKGRSLFRRLMSITVIQAQQQEKANGGLASSEKRQFEKRMRLLQIAAGGKPRVGQANNVEEELEEIYKKAWVKIPLNQTAGQTKKRARYEFDEQRVYLNLWWEKASSLVRTQRDAMKTALHKDHLGAYTLGKSNTLYIVVEKFSRALKTALRVLPVTKYNIQIYTLDSERGHHFLSSRLIHHVLNNERWFLPYEESDPKLDCADREILSGSIEGVQTLINQGDAVLFVSAASGVKDDTTVYTTSNPEISQRLSDICESVKCQFDLIALSGIHKLDWDKFYQFQRRLPQSTAVNQVMDDLEIDGSHLDGLRNTLARGVHQIRVSKVILGLDEAEQAVFDGMNF